MSIELDTEKSEKSKMRVPKNESSLYCVGVLGKDVVNAVDLGSFRVV